MYTKPDFVKIDFNIKDNFAAYDCPYNVRWDGNLTQGSCTNPGDITSTYVVEYESAFWQCYSELDAPDNYPL